MEQRGVVEIYQNTIRPLMAFVSKDNTCSAVEFLARELCTQLTLMIQLDPVLKKKYKCVQWVNCMESWGIQWKCSQSGEYRVYECMFAGDKQNITMRNSYINRSETTVVGIMNINCGLLKNNCYAYFKSKDRWDELNKWVIELFEKIKAM